MSRRWRAALMPALWVWSGDAKRQLAREVASAGRSGVVINVHYPPDRPWRSIHRDWREIRVTVTGGFEQWFYPAARRRRPFHAEVQPGDVTVDVVSNSFERLHLSFHLAAGRVQVVDVHPRLVYAFVWQAEPSIGLDGDVATWSKADG